MQTTRQNASEIFGHEVQIRRKARGLSQRDFAGILTTALGRAITQSTMCKTELGLRPVAIEEAVVIARLLGTTIDTMLGMTDEPDIVEQIVMAQTEVNILSDEVGALVDSAQSIVDRLRRAEEGLSDLRRRAEVDQ